MLTRWMPLVPALVAAFSFSSNVVAQRSTNPASTTWIVEYDRVLNPNENYVFVPVVWGDGTWGMWVNYDSTRVWGYGMYYWNPTNGTIDYENLSDDGGGGQTGQYTWDGSKYVRNRASHPDAKRMVLHPQQ